MEFHLILCSEIESITMFKHGLRCYLVNWKLVVWFCVSHCVYIACILCILMTVLWWNDWILYSVISLYVHNTGVLRGLYITLMFCFQRTWTNQLFQQCERRNRIYSWIVDINKWLLTSKLQLLISTIRIADINNSGNSRYLWTKS